MAEQSRRAEIGHESGRSPSRRRSGPSEVSGGEGLVVDGRPRAAGWTRAGKFTAPPLDLRCAAALSSLPLSLIPLSLSLDIDGDSGHLAGCVATTPLLFPREGIVPLFSRPLDRAELPFSLAVSSRGVRLSEMDDLATPSAVWRRHTPGSRGDPDARFQIPLGRLVVA